MPNGVNDPFGLTFFCEMENLLATNGVFQEHRASRANLQRDRSIFRYAELARFNVAIGVSSVGSELILLYIVLAQLTTKGASTI